MEPTALDPTPPLDRAMAPEDELRLFEPPRSPIWTAIGLNRGLIAICAVLLCLAGLGYGLIREPTYTSSATLQVGDVNPNSPGFLGYVQSSTALAAAFSRAIGAEQVLVAVERQTGIPATEAVKRLSAEPIPLSPAFRVIATGPDEGKAKELAESAARAIVVYEGRANSSNAQAKVLLREYRKASLKLHQAEAAAGRLEAEGGAAFLNAEAARSAAKVRVGAIENAYVAAVTSQAPRRGLVSMVAGATSAENDRKSTLELYGLLGLVLGAFLGCVLAVVREQRWHPPEDSNPAPA
jgi:uncharacterized protein involved in exopolysaccharide biosynthesis